MDELMNFEGFNVGIIEVKGNVLFELYSTGMALGYVNFGKNKNNPLPHKTRINKILENAEIKGCVHGVNTYLTEENLYDFMLEARTEKCKKFRRWVTSEVLPQIRKTGGYIPVEENETEQEVLAKAFLIANKTIENQKLELEKKDKVIENQKPKVLFADAVSTSKTTILIGDLAKLIKQNGVDVGQKRLFVWLRENGYLIKRKGADYNSPTQLSMNLELFEIKETSITHSDGHVTISKTTKVTGKGQQYFINKFLNK